MGKILRIVITRCDDCKYRGWEWCGNGRGAKYLVDYCRRAKKPLGTVGKENFESLAIIPKWCPLPDGKRSDMRVKKRILDEVCLDCCDYLKHPCVDCGDCPVGRLKQIAINKIKAVLKGKT